MTKSLSVDLRRRVVDAIAAGMSRRQAALRFGVSAASAVRWQKQFSEIGTVRKRCPSRTLTELLEDCCYNGTVVRA